LNLNNKNQKMSSSHSDMRFEIKIGLVHAFITKEINYDIYKREISRYFIQKQRNFKKETTHTFLKLIIIKTTTTQTHQLTNQIYVLNFYLVLNSFLYNVTPHHTKNSKFH
jgi:hypothetical protein